MSHSSPTDTIDTATRLASGGDGIIVTAGSRWFVIPADRLTSEVNALARAGSSYSRVRALVCGPPSRHWQDMATAPTVPDWPIEGLTALGEIVPMVNRVGEWLRFGCDQPITPIMWRECE